jgi:hypothetical protein
LKSLSLVEIAEDEGLPLSISSGFVERPVFVKHTHWHDVVLEEWIGSESINPGLHGWKPTVDVVLLEEALVARGLTGHEYSLKHWEPPEVNETWLISTREV